MGDQKVAAILSGDAPHQGAPSVQFNGLSAQTRVYRMTGWIVTGGAVT